MPDFCDPSKHVAMIMPAEPAAATLDPVRYAVARTDSCMDWPAAFAGAALACALFVVLPTSGAGIGPSMGSTEPGEGVSLRWFTIAVVIWFVWITILVRIGAAVGNVHAATLPIPAACFAATKAGNHRDRNWGWRTFGR